MIQLFTKFKCCCMHIAFFCTIDGIFFSRCKMSKAVSQKLLRVKKKLWPAYRYTITSVAVSAIRKVLCFNNN